MPWMAVAAGGALGSAARHGVNLLMTRWSVRAAPLSTAVVNTVGCAVIGVLAGVLAGLLASGRLSLSPTARTFVFVGLLGGFTTFSSFGLDTFTLAHGGHRGAALLNVLGQLVLGLGAVAAGYLLATRP